MTSEPRRRTSRLVLAVVTVAGAGTMTVELAAVRLLAPWFGTSSGVWTNVIGVILLALALGYLAGARLSCRAAPARLLGIALLLAAATTVWLPVLARPVAETFMPRGLALDEAAELLVWGSLAASIVLFLPSAFLLGCIGPLAVEAEQRAGHEHAGDAGGRVLCLSTLGSLFGTFATTHLFLPSFGLGRTFLGAAIALAAAGIVTLLVLREKPPKVGLAALLLFAAGTLFGADFERPSASAGLTLIEARESPYQSLRVVANEELGLRYLQVNESFDSFQSVWQKEPGLLPDGYYYNLFSLPPAWALRETPGGDTWRLLVVGLGAGTAVRVLEGTLPASVRLVATGIEIDPVVVELGERHFDLERGPGRAVYGGVDGRAALQTSVGPFDQIVLDAFANNMEVPAHLASLECFQAARARLAPGGWLAVNAAGFGLDDPVVEALANTIAAAFDGPVLGLRVPFSRNCVLYAREAAELPRPGDDAWHCTGPPASLLPALELPDAWHIYAHDWNTPVLTDDKNPIDRLQLRSVTAGRRRWVDEL